MLPSVFYQLSMLRRYGRLLPELSTQYARYASAVAAPKRRKRSSAPKSSVPTPEALAPAEASQDGGTKEKPLGLLELQASLEASGYSKRKKRTIKPKTAVVVEEPVPKTKKQRKTKIPPLPPRLLPPTSQKHHDLASFLTHARDANLNLESTVYRGTHFEYTVAHALRSFDFMLQRTGRANDLGIDLVGHWMLPTQQHGRTMPLIVQCKAAKSTPAMVRELEGAYVGAPSGWRGQGVLGMLVSTHAMTKGVLAAVQRSRWALSVMQITREGVVKQFLWNAVAAEAGLEGLGIAVRYNCARGKVAESENDGAKSEVEQSIGLTWMGKPWRPVVAHALGERSENTVKPPPKTDTDEQSQHEAIVVT